MTTVKELVKMANQAYRANPGADVDTVIERHFANDLRRGDRSLISHEIRRLINGRKP